MHSRYSGGITWVLGTLTALVGLWIAVAPSAFESRNVGAALIVAGVLLRIEAALLRRSSDRGEPDQDEPRRPWHGRE